MQVILKQNFDNLGYKDDLVEVKSGYARNYLIPKGIAGYATESALKVRAENIKQRAHKIEKERMDAEAMAAKLKEMTIKIGAKAGENGKIFGSVNNIQLADALKKLGYDTDRKNIKIKEEPIKQLGTYEATIKFTRNLKETISFEVVEE